MIEEDRCVYCDSVGVMLYPGVCGECHDFGIDARVKETQLSPEE